MNQQSQPVLHDESLRDRRAGDHHPDRRAPASCPTGCPAFLAYGSVLDNVSNDPTTLEPQFTGQLNTDQIGCIFAYTTAQCQGKYAKTPIRRAVEAARMTSF